MNPTTKRRAVPLLLDFFGASKQFAGKVIGLPRSTQRSPLTHETPTGPDRPLRTHLCLWTDVPRSACRPRRKRGGTCPITNAQGANVIWAIDFQFDSLPARNTHQVRTHGG